MEYFEVITDAKTGEKTIRHYSPEEIAAIESAKRPATTTEATAAVLLAIAMVEEALTAGVPLSEKLSWSAKESAARNLLAGTSAPKDMELLAGEATITGETVEDLALSVVARADQYRFAVSRLAGIRRAATASIAAAKGTADLEQAVALAQAQCGAIIEAANGV